MTGESPALGTIFARTRYDAIMAAVGPRRNQLLAGEYQMAVFAAMRELSSAKDISLDWSHPDTTRHLYQDMDLSCLPLGWTVLGAVVQPRGFVWVIATAADGAEPNRWTMIYEFGYRFESGGYHSEWVPTGKGACVLQVRPEEYGPELLGVALAKRLAAISVARDLDREN